MLRRTLVGLTMVSFASGASAQVLRYDQYEWRRVDTPVSPSAVNVIGTYDPVAGHIVVAVESASCKYETWTYDGVLWTRVACEDSYVPIVFASCFFDHTLKQPVLTGGDDVWTWDGAKWESLQVSGNGGYWGPSISYDSARGVAVLVGVCDFYICLFRGGSGQSPEEWKTGQTTWNTRIRAGNYSTMCATTYDTARQEILSFGGFIGAPWYTLESRLLQSWNGKTWTVLSESGPSARYSAAFTYDESRHFAMLSGGYVPNTREILDDLWRWNGVIWEEIEPRGGVRRPNSAGAVFEYDAGRDVFVYFDGSETWELVPACYADCDTSTGSGVIDILDFLCFQNSFVNGESYACDCDTSTGFGVCDVFDFLCFQNVIVGGCP